MRNEVKKDFKEQNKFETFFTAEVENALIDCFNQGGKLTVYPKGKSMLPTVKEGKDYVILSPPHLVLKNEVYLFKRKNGDFVLHRLIDIKENILIFCGDGQLVLEEVEKSQLLAHAESIYRGKKRKNDTTKYKLFLRLNSIFFIRKAIIRTRSLKRRFISLFK